MTRVPVASVETDVVEAIEAWHQEWKEWRQEWSEEIKKEHELYAHMTVVFENMSKMLPSMCEQLSYLLKVTSGVPEPAEMAALTEGGSEDRSEGSSKGTEKGEGQTMGIFQNFYTAIKAVD
jgi:hypothetical protein